MKYNPKIHHRRSIRLKHYDYSGNGYYFVTICTKNFQCWLGDVVNGKMKLSNIGEIVKKCWMETPQHFDNVFLDVFVVMPNHFHGIVVIENECNAPCRGVACNAPTNVSPKPKSLPTIIRSFKSAVTNWCNKHDFSHFQWHRNYYEHVIRTEHELNSIREYIINNPLQWESDENNPAKIKKANSGCCA